MFDLLRSDQGILPQNSMQVFNVKAFPANGLGGLVTVTATLNEIYARRGQLPTGIVSMSLGIAAGLEVDRMGMVLAINRLLAAGFVVVAAAGNENGPVQDVTTGVRRLPASLPGVTAVGGVQLTDPTVDSRWVDSAVRGSNYGPEVRLFAPSKQFVRAANGQLVDIDGTSGATAMAAGVMSSATAFRPGLTPAQTVPYLLGRLNYTPIVDARGSTSAILFSDLPGYVPGSGQGSSIGLPYLRGGCPPYWSHPEASREVIGLLAPNQSDLFVLSKSFRSANCPGNALNTGAVDFVVEKFIN